MGFILGLVLDHTEIFANPRLRKLLNGFTVSFMPQSDCFGKYLRAFSSPLSTKSLHRVDTVVIVFVQVC